MTMASRRARSSVSRTTRSSPRSRSDGRTSMRAVSQGERAPRGRPVPAGRRAHRVGALAGLPVARRARRDRRDHDVHRGHHQAKELRDRLRVQSAALRELCSTPIIPICDEVLVLPLIGTLDERRSQQLAEALLNQIADKGAQICIVDLTGVSAFDTRAASALARIAPGRCGCLGVEVVLTGIRPEVAQALIGLEVELSSTTRRDLRIGSRSRWRPGSPDRPTLRAQRTRQAGCSSPTAGACARPFSTAPSSLSGSRGTAIAPSGWSVSTREPARGSPPAPRSRHSHADTSPTPGRLRGSRVRPRRRCAADAGRPRRRGRRPAGSTRSPCWRRCRGDRRRHRGRPRGRSTTVVPTNRAWWIVQG